MKTLLTVQDVAEWKAQLIGDSRGSPSVALIPTMGALHEGHLSLVTHARETATHTVASIFVNPTQFGPNEDFAKYPRTLKDDMEKLQAAGCDAVFAPSVAAIYPAGFQTAVTNNALAKGLCGASRPGHFDGVLTVVLKLFQIVQPQIAVFGKKDYQQLQVIAAMVRDLNVPVEVVGGEIVRESDGLALSSRNRYLSQEERQAAPEIHRAMNGAAELWNGHLESLAAVKTRFLKLLGENPLLQLEYVEICRQRDLLPFEAVVESGSGDPDGDQFVMLVACRLGKTRLIDNWELPPKS